MPYVKKTPAPIAEADTTISGKLDAARKDADAARTAIGVATLDGDEPAKQAAQLALDEATRTVITLEAAQSIATARQEAQDAADKAEAKRQHYQRQQAALGALQTAAGKVDDVILQLADAVHVLIDAEKAARALVSDASGYGTSITCAHLHLKSAIAWALKLPGGGLIWSPEQAKLRPRFPMPDPVKAPSVA